MDSIEAIEWKISEYTYASVSVSVSVSVYGQWQRAGREPLPEIADKVQDNKKYSLLEYQ